MKRYLLIFLLAFYFCSRENKQMIIIQESQVTRNNCKKVSIPENYDNILQIDSIFEKVEVVPLETNKRCLITSPEKILSQDNTFYIQNGNDNLYVFSSSGLFVNEIGGKGKGPGEFYSIRDFDIDKKGNVYILDFNRILMYSKQGKLLESYKFEYSPKNTIHCNPIQFALCGENEFYVWGGSFSIYDNKKGNLFAMYKINKKGEIIERYFQLKHKISLQNSLFDKCPHQYNISPIYGNDTIFKVSKNGVDANYKIDFGSLKMPQSVPNNFEDLSEYKAEIDQRYANSIRNVIETSDWLYFMFSYKGYAKNVFYSKKINKPFVSKPYPRVPNRIMPWMIHSKEGEDFIALIEPRIIIEDLKVIENMSDEVIKIKNALNKTNINDNHVILRCKMKKY